VYVAGTCAQGNTAREQMQNIFAVIEPSLLAAGASLRDVVSTRLYAADIENDWEEIGAAHAEILGDPCQPVHYWESNFCPPG
jgi:enamine deaminase RidA (YjgF/YER057c/UK114 family)